MAGLPAVRACVRNAQLRGTMGGMANRLEDRLRSRVVIKPDDPHAAPAMTDPHNREPARYTEPPDEIELACAGCTLIYRDARWRHDPACIFARTRAD